MIFVTVGTEQYPFERLLRAVDELPGDEDLVVQSRADPPRPGRAVYVRELPYEQLVADVVRARVVVCHAGVGSILTVLANDKRPIVVPRLQRYGEHVDDHQLLFARRLAEAGLVTLVEDTSALADAVASTPTALPAAVGASRLAVDLRATLEQLVYSR